MLASVGMPLLVHGEVTDHEIDIFDREAVFIEQVMKPLLARHPKLKVVFEHITTQQAAEFVAAAPDNIAATITAHHLLFNRNKMLAGGIRPHYYCLPILKREQHRQALLKAATSGSPKFFLGTDSAPHAQGDKESAAAVQGHIQRLLPLNSMQLPSKKWMPWTARSVCQPQWTAFLWITG